MKKHVLTDDEAYTKYMEWWGTRDMNVFDLHAKAMELDSKYFMDMQLKTPELSDYDNFFETDDGDRSLEYYHITYHIEELEDAFGIYDYLERSITIAPDYVSKDEVLLHEMIHAYEDMLDKHKPKDKEIIFLELYKFLKEQDIDIDNRIKSHAFGPASREVAEQGGAHGIFFLLKSLELDIKCGYKLGTVCGYGRDEY